MNREALDDVQDVIDAMAQAVRECACGDWSANDMWLEIDACCQKLTSLADAACAPDEEAEDETDDDVQDLNFDGEDQMLDGDAFEEDEDLN